MNGFSFLELHSPTLIMQDVTVLQTESCGSIMEEIAVC